MSLAKWKAIYYPDAATSLSARRDPVAHSLRKWQGLAPAVLRLYGLRKRGNRIVEIAGDEWMAIDAETCALCHEYEHSGDCPGCPLYQFLGEQRCDIGMNSPYQQWFSLGRANPMVEALRVIHFDEQE